MKQEQQKPVYYDGSVPLKIPGAELKHLKQPAAKSNLLFNNKGLPCPSLDAKNKQQKPIYYDGSGILKL
jgi:hypothetical protein